MNFIRKIIISSGFILLFFIFGLIKVHGTTITDEKYYCNATIEDNFSDDSVLVVLNKEASYRLIEYDEKDFSTINCEKVTNLTKTAKRAAVEKKENPLVNLDNYRCTLCIKLKEKSKENVLKTINELIKREDVIYAGPDYLISVTSTTPRDPYISSQWGIDSTNLKSAWDFTVGNNSVIVGIMDSGIDASHPDLSGRVITNLSRDYTGNEPVSITTVTDPLGHGTHVAGIIGATGDNLIGVSGVNWNINFASLRVFDENGYGYSSHLENAIDFAEENFISILNFSGRWYSTWPTYDVALNTIISTYEGLIVCAAGNDNIDNDGLTPALPASINLDNIISVGAIDSSDNRCSFSNYGRNSVDIFAPGEDILSTYPMNFCNNLSYVFYDDTHLCEMWSPLVEYFRSIISSTITWDYINEHFSEYMDDLYGDPNLSPSDFIVIQHYANGYHYMSGTSMATPFVTGVAALLLSINPNLTTTQIKTAIMNSAEIPNVNNINPLEDLCVTDGKLNAYGAVKYVLDNYIINLNCATTMHSLMSNCPENGSIVYKVNIKCPKSYKFISNALSPLEMIFYNSNFSELTTITSVMTNNNCTGTITTYLNPGTYYLRVNYVNATDSGNITTSYQATWPVTLNATFNTNLNILSNLHLTGNNDYHCVVSFNNTFGEKLFKFKLDAGNNTTYPEGAIKVYTDSTLTNQLDRYSVSGLTYPASSNVKENELYVFLPEKGTYYIEITVPRNDYNSLQFLVSNVDEMSINYLNTLATSTLTNVFSYKTDASYFKKVDISHKSKIKIELNSNTGCFNSTKLFIFKLNKDPGYDIGVNHYSLSSILQVNLTFDEDSYNTTLILDEGTYYIGYTNNINCSLNLNLRRLINTNVNMDGTLVADPMPNQRYTIGSEVLLNNGSYNNYNITEGFTRCIYLMNGNTLLEPSSRLLYDWYSSDDDVALVRQYGTVLAKSVTSNTNVTIYAILKEDPSVVYRKTFTILNDTLTYSNAPINIYSSMTIGAGVYTPIDLSDEVVPINILQYYSWSISQGGSVDYWGNIYANTTSLGDTLYITGNYMYNSRVKIFIDALVTLPMSGYELDYNQLLWDDDVEENNNCYNYAINSQVWPGTNTLWFKQQPGQYSESMTYDYSDYDAMYTAVHNDFVKYNQIYNTNLIFMSIDKFAKCPEGTYKVALVACSDDWDYHWYRQDSDGYWSHKPGTSFVRRYDDSYDLIIDPSNCDWGVYDTFLGFFAVSPWNTMYTEPENMRTLGETNPSISLIDLDDIEDLEIGMSYYEVIQTLGSAGLDIGSGTIIQLYETTSNNIVLINYHLVNGEYVVASIDVE